MKFEILNLHEDILKGVKDAGFERCTPIQEQSLPECLAGKDMIAQSQTGSGKTAVFLLSIFTRLLGQEKRPGRGPRALIMEPTRELAHQVHEDAVKLGRHLPFGSAAIYGGVEYDKQIAALKSGVEIIAATPGRMIDLYKSKALSLDSIDIFVIDEADRMFDMGFAPDITYIAGRLPKGRPRQTMLFSATIDRNVHRLSSRYMSPDAVTIEIEPEQITVSSIDQKILYVSNEEKFRVLLALLKRPDVKRSIIFTNMKRTAEMLDWKLKGNGLPVKVLTGDVSQAQRQRVIDGMKAGRIELLVATDVAARGLHIEGITHIINYDLPDEAANYVHRIGRTARAGKEGKAYSLVCEDHALALPDIEKYIEHKIEKEWLEESEIPEDKSGEYRARRRSPAPTARGGADRKRPSRAAKPAGGSGGSKRKTSSPRRPVAAKPASTEPSITISSAEQTKPAAEQAKPAPEQAKTAPEATKPAAEQAKPAAEQGAEGTEAKTGPPRRRRRPRRPRRPRVAGEAVTGQGGNQGTGAAGGAGKAGEAAGTGNETRAKAQEPAKAGADAKRTSDAARRRGRGRGRSEARDKTGADDKKTTGKRTEGAGGARGAKGAKGARGAKGAGGARGPARTPAKSPARKHGKKRAPKPGAARRTDYSTASAEAAARPIKKEGLLKRALSVFRKKV